MREWPESAFLVRLCDVKCRVPWPRCWRPFFCGCFAEMPKCISVCGFCVGVQLEISAYSIVDANKMACVVVVVRVNVCD